MEKEEDFNTKNINLLKELFEKHLECHKHYGEAFNLLKELLLEKHLEYHKYYDRAFNLLKELLKEHLEYHKHHDLSIDEYIREGLALKRQHEKQEP